MVFIIPNTYIELQDTKAELKEFRGETSHRFDQLEDNLDDLEATNATNHINTNRELSKISNELDFLSHKEYQTEKQMYYLKQRLMGRQRNTK